MAKITVSGLAKQLNVAPKTIYKHCRTLGIEPTKITPEDIPNFEDLCAKGAQNKKKEKYEVEVKKIAKKAQKSIPKMVKIVDKPDTTLPPASIEEVKQNVIIEITKSYNQINTMLNNMYNFLDEHEKMNGQYSIVTNTGATMENSEFKHYLALSKQRDTLLKIMVELIGLEVPENEDEPDIIM